MEDYTSLYHQSILTTRKLILDARFNKYHRAEWEEDRVQELLFLAEANLKSAEDLLTKVERDAYG